jgi:hypothetical protein
VLAAVFCGVVLPAVWMKDEKRRRDARAVLQMLLRVHTTTVARRDRKAVKRR